MQVHYYLSTPVPMPITLSALSTLTDRYQTTVPESVRRALKLTKRDKIHYAVRPDGKVVLSRADPLETEDPVIQNFLGFLAEDLVAHPERIRRVDADLLRRIRSLVGAAKVDLEAPLVDADE